jgi:hypothetical protein
MDTGALSISSTLESLDRQAVSDTEGILNSQDQRQDGVHLLCPELQDLQLPPLVSFQIVLGGNYSAAPSQVLGFDNER